MYEVCVGPNFALDTHIPPLSQKCHHLHKLPYKVPRLSGLLYSKLFIVEMYSACGPSDSDVCWRAGLDMFRHLCLRTRIAPWGLVVQSAVYLLDIQKSRTYFDTEQSLICLCARSRMETND